MAHTQHSPKATVLSAKQKILKKLCTVYIRSKDSSFIPADKLRQELGIPEPVFAEAMKSFTDTEEQMAVEVIESRGGMDLRLAESMRNLCSDWS